MYQLNVHINKHANKVTDTAWAHSGVYSVCDAQDVMIRRIATKEQDVQAFRSMIQNALRNRQPVYVNILRNELARELQILKVLQFALYKLYEMEKEFYGYIS